MKRFLLLLLIATLIPSLLLVFGCQQSSTNDTTTPITTGPTTSSPTTHVVGNQPGNLAPDFNLQDLDGDTVSLSDFKGSPILLNFWEID